MASLPVRYLLVAGVVLGGYESSLSPLQRGLCNAFPLFSLVGEQMGIAPKSLSFLVVPARERLRADESNQILGRQVLIDVVVPGWLRLPVCESGWKLPVVWVFLADERGQLALLVRG